MWLPIFFFLDPKNKKIKKIEGVAFWATCHPHFDQGGGPKASFEGSQTIPKDQSKKEKKKKRKKRKSFGPWGWRKTDLGSHSQRGG